MKHSHPAGHRLVEDFGAWCAPCRFRFALPLSHESLLELMGAPSRAFEPLTLVTGVLSADGKPHHIRLIPTGSNAREPGAYIEFVADHEPFWSHHVWIAASRLRDSSDHVAGDCAQASALA